MRDYLDYSPPSLCSFLGAITPAQAILGSAGISGATSLAGGKKGANAATQAAQIQAQAAQQALAFQQQVYQTGQSQLAPYIDFGTAVLQGQLPSTFNYAVTPIDTSLPQWQPTMAQLESTPGYQFNLQESLNALQGRGGVNAGNAASLASNLASTTYQQQFGNYLANVQNLMASRGQELQQKAQVFNVASAGAGIGSNAIATGLGFAGGMAQQVGSSLQNIGAAQASGVVGSANALTQGLSGIGGAASNAGTLLALTGGNAAQAAGVVPENFASNPTGGMGLTPGWA